MPELPEVEVLVRHLAASLPGARVIGVEVLRPKVVRPDSVQRFRRALLGARFTRIARRGKYLVFTLRPANKRREFPLLGHLGMTGRMFLQAAGEGIPRHAAVVLHLGRIDFIYQDTRYFGRMTLDPSALDELGPEPLGTGFTPEAFALALGRSAQPIKVKLLDQAVVAGIGNIYASEALFRARISPRRSARRLKPEAVRRLWRAIRTTLAEAVDWGSTVPLNWSGAGKRDGLFYYGQAVSAPTGYGERLAVYDRAGKPCLRCGRPIRRIVQAARSTFYCPTCQHDDAGLRA
jgi:formamidopyrimidine-DNA glycosylase